MKQDNFYSGKEALEKLIGGIKKISNIVGSTMGSGGSNAILEALENPYTSTTNDGYTIAKAIYLSDPVEQMGANILREAIGRANRQSGDGSSTTCVLTAAILEEGMKRIGDVSPMELKRSLEACIPIIEEAVKAQKKDITIDNVAPVASISAEDEGIGNTIQEIYKQIGKDGIIQWDISKTPEDSYTLGSGITINGATVVAPYMLENAREIRLRDPKILLIRRKITSGEDFTYLFYNLHQSGIKEAVVFCDEIENAAITSFSLTQGAGRFKTTVIKMPILWKDEWWEDLALATGGKIIDANSGIKIQDIKEEHLGTVKNLTITKEDTLLEGIKDLTDHIKSLQTEGDEKSLLRASRLNTKTARYFVGGHSDQAIFYRRLKVEDAINAAHCALESGVVPGGGVALLNAVRKLQDTVGGHILHKALAAPIRQIALNAGIDLSLIDSSVGDRLGFDTRTGKLVDMFEAQIIDPTSVVINAIKSAIGVAATILTANSVVLLPSQETKNKV